MLERKKQLESKQMKRTDIIIKEMIESIERKKTYWNRKLSPQK